MNGLTLKHLRYFAALAKTRHFAQAAGACGISQPALSLQIKQLEDLVGAPLVERTTRQVHLTSLGQILADHAEEMLRRVAVIEEAVRAARGDLSGPFRLGIIPTIAPYLLPEVMTRISKRFGELRVILRETMTPHLVDELHAGTIDAAIVALPISEPAFTEVRLFSENFILVRPQTQADQPPPSVDSLKSMRLLLLEEGHCFRDQALSFCKLGQDNYRNILEGSSLTTLVQLVSSGVGVTLIPEMAARIEAGLANVDLVSFPEPQPARSIGMIWRRSSPLQPHLMTLSGLVRDAAMALREAHAH